MWEESHWFYQKLDLEYLHFLLQLLEAKETLKLVQRFNQSFEHG
jgi:hypothetical protein